MRLGVYLTAFRAWCQQWSVKTRRTPSRHCRGARVYGHTTTVMHDTEYISPIEYTPPPARARSSKYIVDCDVCLLIVSTSVVSPRKVRVNGPDLDVHATVCTSKSPEPARTLSPVAHVPYHHDYCRHGGAPTVLGIYETDTLHEAILSKQSSSGNPFQAFLVGQYFSRQSFTRKFL